jgi:translation initiation factor 2 beta subunit (eIF-2beta)/eIF-5
MNQKQLLVDCITFEFVKDALFEAAVHDQNRRLVVKGVLQRAKVKNQNGRVYPKDVLFRESKKYEENFIKERRALGELDHPESSVVNLQNVSHNVIETHWEGDDLIGTVEVLPTPNGNILKELFRANIRLGISSRGLGTVNKNMNEDADVVQDDFELIAFDFVSNPSTKGAFMFPSGHINESTNKELLKNPTTGNWERAEDIVRTILTEIGK